MLWGPKMVPFCCFAPLNCVSFLLPIHPGCEPPLRYAWLCSRKARLCARHEFFFEKTIGGTLGLLSYLMTRKSLDAARCTGEPLQVIARNRVFLCILHCCIAFRRLFVAFLEAQVGNHLPEVAAEVQKILYRNRCGLRFGGAQGTGR